MKIFNIYTFITLITAILLVSIPSWNVNSETKNDSLPYPAELYAMCFDGIDNDGDGFTDANDPQCPRCYDQVDNDGDSLVDKSDPDCPKKEDVRKNVATAQASTETVETQVIRTKSAVRTNTIKTKDLVKTDKLIRSKDSVRTTRVRQSMYAKNYRATDTESVNNYVSTDKYVGSVISKNQVQGKVGTDSYISTDNYSGANQSTQTDTYGGASADIGSDTYGGVDRGGDIEPYTGAI